MYVCWIYKLILDCDRFNEVFPDHKYIFFFFFKSKCLYLKDNVCKYRGKVSFHFASYR